MSLFNGLPITRSQHLAFPLDYQECPLVVSCRDKYHKHNNIFAYNNPEQSLLHMKRQYSVKCLIPSHLFAKPYNIQNRQKKKHPKIFVFD